MNNEAFTKYSKQYEAEKGKKKSYGLYDFTLFSSVSDPNSGYVYIHDSVLKSVDTLILHESITFNSDCNCDTRLGWNDYMKITDFVGSKIGSSLDDTIVFRSYSCAPKVFDEMSKIDSVVVDMYAKYGMASLGFKRLQASAITRYCRFLLFGFETRRLKVQVADHAKIVAELELARSETMIFKTKIIFEAQQHKGHTINIKERISRMQEQDLQDFVDISVKMMDSMVKYNFVVIMILVTLLANLNAEKQIHNMGHEISAFKLVPALLFLCWKDFFLSGLLAFTYTVASYVVPYFIDIFVQFLSGRKMLKNGGGNTIVPVASEQLPTFLTAPQWQKHHVVLLGLVQIEEDCYRVMIKILEQMVSMALSSFHNPHPRVRWTAINAIMGPDSQNQYHQTVLPALASAINNFKILLLLCSSSARNVRRRS